MKIPFDIKYRPQIESGEYKVETRDGSPARVVCWDANSYTPIVFLVTEHDGLDDKDKEYTYSCNNFGRAFSIEAPRDLFIVTPEPELSRFEEGLNAFLFDFVHTTVEEDPTEYIKKNSGVLLSLAREQLRPEIDAEIAKAYKNADNTVYENGVLYGKAEALKEIEQDPESSYAFKRGVEYGKEEALKDLPRWKKCDFQMGTENPFPRYLVKTGGAHYSLTSTILKCDEYIPLSELAKLPKEDSHE